jgi:hypothetical protein
MAMTPRFAHALIELLPGKLCVCMPCLSRRVPVALQAMQCLRLHGRIQTLAPCVFVEFVKVCVYVIVLAFPCVVCV